ncbi:MAG TPA: 50S ribosomal protein L4 [Gammaproteobacteria bacterium]|nr:50S ribosomal protein L4 [Gammaproteobacteria bacterium]
MDIAIHNSKKKVSVSDAAFGASFNEALVHQLVVSYMASGRAGTKAQKNRAAVSGGGAKPWRQKGTGRARAGTIRSPLWRSGGVTFAATPRDYSKKINKKMYRAGLRSLVSELVRQERLIVIDKLGVTEPKTRLMQARLDELGVDNALVLTDGLDSAVYLAARNIPGIQVMDIAIVDPVSLISPEKVVIDEAALKKLEERLS